MNLFSIMGEIIANHWQTLLRGLAVTLELTLISVVIGFFIGVLLALGRVYGNRIVYAICTGIVEVIRGTPLLVQLFILYYGLPAYGIRLGAIVSAIIAFSINSGAYQAEYLRGSIQSLERNQMLAARSMGMTRRQAIAHIVLPQAFRRVVPAWTNEFIYLLKYTSLAYIVGAPELMGMAKIIGSRIYFYFEIYLIVAFMYLAVVLVFSKLFDFVEKKFKIPGLETIR